MPAPQQQNSAMNALPFQTELFNMPDFAAAERKLALAVQKLKAAPNDYVKAIFASITAPDYLPEITQIAEDWRRECNDLVVIGAGGSGLSSKALALLKPHTLTHHLHTLDNLDPYVAEALMAKLDWKKTACLTISKSGSTTEALAYQQVLLTQAKQHLSAAEIAKRFAVITADDASPLATCAKAHNMKIIPHAKYVGGRFSVFTAVGLLPSLFIGLNVQRLLAGAEDSLNAGLQENSAALQGAALQYTLIQAGRTIEVFMPYSRLLQGLALWWRQSFAESLGKDGKGATPLIALGTGDQHSQLQLFLDGPADKQFTLILPDYDNKGAVLGDDVALACLKGKTLGDVIASQQQGTLETLIHKGLPVRAIRVNALDEYTLGGLFAHFMLEIIFLGELLGVNAFDQPAVEMSKKISRDYLLKK